METITSAPAVGSTHVDPQQECREESIAELLQPEDAVLINDLDDEIADNVRKVTPCEILDSLDAVKYSTEIHGDKQMNIMLIELIGKMKTLKSQNFRQSTIRMLLKNKVLFSMIIFSSKKSKTPHSGHLLIACTFSGTVGVHYREVFLYFHFLKAFILFIYLFIYFLQNL